MLRELAYMFLYNEKSKAYSTVGKAVFSLSLIFLLCSSTKLEGIPYYAYPIAIACIELGVVSYLKGFYRALRAVTVIAFFMVLGSAVFAINKVLGYPSPQYDEIIMGAVRIFSFFLAFSLFFQLISLEEWRGIMIRLGFRNQALILSMISILLPLTLIHFSEALVAVKLKYGGKRLTSLVTPLAFLAVMNSRNIVEAYVLYPLRIEGEVSLFRPRDLILYGVVIALTAPLISLMIR